MNKIDIKKTVHNKILFATLIATTLTMLLSSLYYFGFNKYFTGNSQEVSLTDASENEIKIKGYSPDKKTEVSLFEIFDVEFNKVVNPDSISIKVEPDTKFEIVQPKSAESQKHLIIAPTVKLKPETEYTITVTKGTSTETDKNYNGEYKIQFKTKKDLKPNI